MEYTKGEWEPEQSGTAIMVEGKRLASLTLSWPRIEREANAHLIASSPDLYEVLNRAFTDPSYVLSGEWYIPAKQALAKAEGKL